MNGAESLVRTLHGAGVDVCFANPGTSEMQFVDALGRTGLMRCVLGLFEGVCAGAADGYDRMADKPAATLLHLGPGLANASANMHNARKARSGMVNLVGDHARRHLAYDAPLTSDVAGVARPFSDWVRTARSAETLAADAAGAVAAAAGRPRGVATLIAPADVGWEEGGRIAPPLAPRRSPAPEPEAVERAARALERGGALLWAGGSALDDPETAARLAAIAARTGARLLTPTSSRRIERGAGRARLDKLPYAVDLALETLAGFRAAVLIEAPEPVAFFAYPDRPSLLLPEGCERLTLAAPAEDGRAATAALAERLGVGPAPGPDAPRPEAPRAVPLTPESVAAAVAAAAPADAILCDESLTAGRAIYEATAGAPPHSWISITGGAIGIGPPLATGAAVARPDRPVVALQADGSAMYTIQALWTQAREGLNVTTVIFANRGYELLKQELFRVGANPGRAALDMLEMTRPEVDFLSLARGLGVEAARVEDARALSSELREAAARPGPFVIEARMA